MGSLAFLGLWLFLFLQTKKAGLPIPWALGISFGVSYWAFLEITDMLARLTAAMNHPAVTSAVVIGMVATVICGALIFYIRRYYATMKDPFKHLR